MSAPRFTHDCKRCRFVDSITVDEIPYDWYLCGADSIIGRYGDEGPAYWSAPVAMIPTMATFGSRLATVAAGLLSKQP